jgi:hypothetical protein
MSVGACSASPRRSIQKLKMERNKLPGASCACSSFPRRIRLLPQLVHCCQKSASNKFTRAYSGIELFMVLDPLFLFPRLNLLSINPKTHASPGVWPVFVLFSRAGGETLNLLFYFYMCQGYIPLNVHNLRAPVSAIGWRLSSYMFQNPVELTAWNG